MEMCVLPESNKATVGTQWISRIPVIIVASWIASSIVTTYILPYYSGHPYKIYLIVA